MKRRTLQQISKSITSGITPFRGNPDFWLNGSIPWLKTEQLGERDIYDTNEKITEKALLKTSIKLNPANTISIAMYGEGKTRGNVSILRKEMTTNQACCNVVLDQALADCEYVYYFLKNQYLNLRSLSSGVRKNLNSGDIKGFTINLPDTIAQQKKIATVLSALDAKIALNHRINVELEGMAKLLYDYWFVQHDFPVSAAQAAALGQPRLTGKPYRSSGGPMVFHPQLKREVPVGWVVKSIPDITPILTGKKDANHATKDGAYHFFTCAEEALKCDDFAFDGRAILLAGNGSFGVKIYEGKFNAYQRTYVLIPHQEKHFASVWFAVKNSVASLTKGSRGSIVKFLTKGDIESIFVPLPTQGGDDLFGPINDALLLTLANTAQNQELTILRDWLLPMLMNGQVRVG